MRDHPRVCGENWIIARRVTTQPGSPPRVRGKLVDLYAEYYGNRITPACAGKTEDFVGNYDRSEDHPRVCGENTFTI